MRLSLNGLKHPFLPLSLPAVPSKSHTIRALLFALMAKGKCVIHNPLSSPDTRAMIRALLSLGARVYMFDERIEVEGTGGALRVREHVIDAGNSGQVLRFVGAIVAHCCSSVIITGDHSLRTLRPVRPLLDGLGQLGALATSTRGNGHAPILINGPLEPGCALVSGHDSQPVSGLLMATSFLEGPSQIVVDNPGEKPWISFTLHWLKRFGIEVENDNFRSYLIPGGASIDKFSFAIPGDFSSATYPIAAALVTRSEITIHGLDFDDMHPDKKVIDILRSMGANILIDKERQVIKVKPSTLEGQTIDVNDIIDALPLLATLSCFAEGKTELTGATIARQKESDRIHVMCIELKKMGAHIEEREDGLIVLQSVLRGAELSAHADHRVALSLAVAALGGRGASHIEGAECIAKSYPTFFDHLKQMGGCR